MKVLLLVENLEVNRTSSGITSLKQIFLYSKIFEDIDVITATHEKHFKKINGVNYYFITSESEDKSSWIFKIPKSRALQNFIFGIDIKVYRSIQTWIKTTKPFLNKNKYDFIVTLGSGASFVPAYAMMHLKKDFDPKHIMFVHDPYPLNQYPPPYQKRNSLPYQSVANKFGEVLKKADIISFPSLKLMEWMNQFYPTIQKKYIIQPHIGMEIDEIGNLLTKNNEEKIPPFSKGLNIVHTGTLLGPRDPNFLIKALKRLFEENPDAKDIINIHVIGKMNKSWNAKQMTTNNVHFYPERISYISSLKIQLNSDVLLLLEAVSDVSPFMPGKLADYLIAKKPILALTPSKSETTRILGKEYALIAENGNIEQIYNKLVLIYNAYLNNSVDKLVPSSKARNHVSPEKWLKELEKIKTDKQI